MASIISNICMMIYQHDDEANGCGPPPHFSVRGETAKGHSYVILKKYIINLKSSSNKK